MRCCAACIGPAYCADKADYDNAIQNYKEKSLYDTGVTAEYGDKLITLVTCSYHEERGRFVVFARQRHTSIYESKRRLPDYSEQSPFTCQS